MQQEVEVKYNEWLLATLGRLRIKVEEQVSPPFQRLDQRASSTLPGSASGTGKKGHQLEGCSICHVPLAVHVPMNTEEIVPERAFAGVPRLRHVSVEPGIRLIGAEAWQNCRQLRIVKLPAAVVGVSDNVFRNCKLPNSVSAPGCGEFGYKAFPNAAPYNGCLHRSCKLV